MRLSLLAGTALIALPLVCSTAALAQTATPPASSTQTPATASGPSPAGVSQNTTTSPAPVPDNASSMAIPAQVGIVADTSGTATTQPEDGQVIVRLNGRFRFYGGLFDDQDLNRTTAANTVTLSPVTLTYVSKGKTLTGTFLTEKTSSTASYTSNKQDTFGFIEYVRLYPGFDGRTAGGLKYGASVEIRQDNTVAPGGGTAGSISSVDTQRGNLYVRREWGYLGTDDLGTVRFGTIDDVSSLYLTGVLENFNDGGWNGDVRYGLASTAQLRWPFADDGSAYETNKIVYLSPSFAGFDFGVSFEPSTAGANIDDGNCSVAGTSNTQGTAPFTVPAALTSIVGCDRLESTTTAIESGRRKDTVDALIRYRHAFDFGLGLAATASYTGGGHVNYTGPNYTASGADFVKPVTYNGLSMGDFGVALTYAGVLVGANYEFGRFSNALASGSSQSFSLAPVGSKPASAWSAGASYTFGPAIVGATWVATDSPGAYSYSAAATPAASAVTPGLGQRHEAGVNTGGTLKVAPGLGVFLSYIWDERKQSGYDFVNSEIVAGGDDPTSNNKIRAQALTLGTSLTW
jgi:hypothetical protein